MQSIASVDLDAIKSLSTDEQMMAGSDVTRWPIPAPPIDVIGWPMPLGYKEEQARPARSTNNTNNLYQGIVMQFSDKDAPAGPTPQILEGMKSVPTKIQDFVRATMDKYQVISRNAVDIMMKKEQLPYRRANMVMPLCAYVMRTGPWRSCWIRYGYDPRTDPESYKYQVLDMRTMDAKNSQSVHRRTKHDDERQKGSDAPLNALEAGSFLFDEEAVRHGRSGIYQVMHVTVPQINYLIAYPNGRRRTICEESGWFHFPLVRAIRLVTNNLRKMLIEGKENPVDMLKLKKALVASIKKEDEEVEERGLLEEKMESISTGKQSEKLKNLRDTRVEELMGDLAMAQGEEEQGGDAGSDADEINFYNDATFDDFEIYGEDSD
ncbi:tau 95 subunit of transcription factor TFIIIC [Linderina macrospora]|uniref:Tau 95 subunit of transcription factor TFIIIC n=1 Tax=Linderina macrospora TaxID=4868 RepID=A0ACC1J9B8_9FUNG|nr:tau 95 subunit of transcription factor TFIIIC [Linderina macrospora]